MKRIAYLIIVLASLSLLQSCVFLTKKQHLALISEKDSLASGWDSAKKEIIKLKKEINDLKSDTLKLHNQIASLQEELDDTKSQYSKLKATYAALIANSHSEVRKISEELSKREARLKEVEDMLRKRDEAAEALKQKLQEALLGFTSSGLAVELRHGKVYVLLTDKLLFNTGSIIVDQRGQEALSEFAKVIKNHPDIQISVEGHTDNQRINNLGQIKDNWDLSVLRATSVVRFLVDGQQLDGKRVTASGKGDTQAVDDNDSPEGRSRNRRIEIVLTPKLDELLDIIKQ